MAENEIASDTGSVATFDMDSAVDRIGESLFPDHEDTTDDTLNEEPEKVVADTPAAPVVPVGRQVPKSWPKEMHEHWGKTDPKVQEYWETREQQMLTGLDQYKTDAQLAKTFQQIIHPFEPILKSQGVDAPQAVQYLLNAHQQLTQGTPEARQAAFDELGKSLGLQAPAGTAVQESSDPAMKAMQQKLQHIESGLNSRQQQDYQALQQQTAKQVETFASDPSHLYFNDVADDIVLLLKTGLPLQEAYEKAIWANPVTREKELQARLTSETEKQKERARLDALPKAKAVKNNVRSMDSRRTPTEPVGTMAETMRDTLREIRSRVS